MNDCPHPETCACPETGNQGVYFCERACCVGRLIANMPGLERRRTMKAWYEKTKGSEFMEAVEKSIIRWFKK